MKKFINLLICLSFVFAASGCASAPPHSQGTAPASEPMPASETPASMPASEAPDLDGTEWHFKDPQSTGNEKYQAIVENEETAVKETSMLTFSLKVDTASYNNVERYINSGNLPPADAVRVEEMINYFNYDQLLLGNDTPFSIYSELGESIFDENKQLAFVRVKSKDIDKEQLPKSNLTFLIDTSGSMNSHDKLPLLKSAFELLTETLTEDDIVSIVTYAGSSEIVLDSVQGDQTERIIKAINTLRAGGSTAGAEGITTAYKLAEKNFVEGGNNRVILATDGDFNVGISSLPELEKLVGKKRGNGVYLSILGFGTGNLRDDVMETLSKNGNGNYGYIDSVSSAKKLLVDELTSNLFTIADDVKAQVEFNPALVKNYRLIGYENRRLRNKDFEDDKKDAGEIGIGTDVVVMFELELESVEAGNLKYGGNEEPQFAETADFADELFEVRIRYKDPGEPESKLITHPVKIDRVLDENTDDFKYASTVAAFGHLLRDSSYADVVNVEDVIDLAEDSLGRDAGGYRAEFVDLVGRYAEISD